MMAFIPPLARPEPTDDPERTGRSAPLGGEAANEVFPRAIGPDIVLPLPALPERARIALALIASLMLHFGTIAILSSSLTFIPVKQNASPPLTVRLAQLAPAASVLTKPVPVVSDTSADSLPLREIVGPATTPARFLADPDLSVLEEIPTTLPGIVSLRLFVSAQGVVERVAVVRADPVPKPLLDGLMDRFGRAKLAPATIGNQPTASTLEVTIRVDPPVQYVDFPR